MGITNHYTILCEPPNKTYIDAFSPRIDGDYVFWFDDSEREHGSKAQELNIDEKGVWRFFNPNRSEKITFIPVMEAKNILPFTWPELIDMCCTVSGCESLFRPFLCRGDLNKVKAFIVGYNPATPIVHNEIDIGVYAYMMLHYEQFENFIREYRKGCLTKTGRKKRELSPTRQGITWCQEWLRPLISGTVLEMNVNAYPTPKSNLLKVEKEEVVEKGHKIFGFLLKRFRPEIVVMHGNETFEQFIRYSKEWNIEVRPCIPSAIEEIQRVGSIAIVYYEDGTEGKVFLCRHFCRINMYKSQFNDFRETVEKENGKIGRLLNT